MLGKRVFLANDTMRGRPSERVSLRFDMKDTIDLACDCVYPAQVYHRPKELRVLKSIEVRVGDNVWQPYPTISWLDGVERPKQLVTKSVVVTKEGKPLVVSTQNGKLDETLTREAEKEGVCVEYLDGL